MMPPVATLLMSGQSTERDDGGGDSPSRRSRGLVKWPAAQSNYPIAFQMDVLSMRFLFLSNRTLYKPVDWTQLTGEQ